MKKRIFAIILAFAMVLALLPAAALAEDGHATKVIIGGVTLDAASPYYHNGENGAAGVSNNVPYGANAWFIPYGTNGATRSELRLSDLYLKMDACAMGMEVAGGEVTLILENDSRSTVDISSHVEPGGSADSVFALYSAAGITVEGAGRLTLISGNAGPNRSSGLCCENLTINGGTLAAEGGAARMSAGIYCGVLTINAGTVRATGGDCAETYGLFAKDVTLEGGALTAEGGTVSADSGVSYGARANSFSVKAGSVTLAGGDGTATGETATVRSIGLLTENSAAFSGGTVDISSGNVPNSASDKSYGIFSDNVAAAINISGGTVTVSGDTGAFSLCPTIETSGLTTSTNTANAPATGVSWDEVTWDTYKWANFSYAYTGGMDFTSTNAQAWAGGKTPARDDCSGAKWQWESGSKRLTLSDSFNFTTTAADAVTLPDGASIVFYGGVAISSNAEGAETSRAIYALGALTIEAGGGFLDSISVNAGKAKNSYGIYAVGTLTLALKDGAEIRAIGDELAENTGTDSVMSAGIYTLDSVVISGGGAVEAYGGSSINAANGDSYGIFAGKNIELSSNGRIIATGGESKMESYGIYAMGTLAINSGDATGTGRAYAIGDTTHTQKSYGIYVNKLDASGGTVTGTSGEAFSESIGIYVKDNTKVAYATVTGTSRRARDKAAGVSTGIYTASLTMSSGSVTGTSYDAFKSTGVAVSAAATVTGGTLLGSGAINDPLMTDSMGIRSDASTEFKILGGTVTAEGYNYAMAFAPTLGEGVGALGSTALADSLGDYDAAAIDTYKRTQFTGTNAAVTMDFTSAAAEAWASGKTPASEDCSGADFIWNAAAKTLTLNNFSFMTDNNVALVLPDGATLMLNGASTVKAEAKARYAGVEDYATLSSAILAKGALTVSGTGTLTATGGDVTALGEGDAASYGMDVLGKLRILGGTLTLAGGTVVADTTANSDSAGLYANRIELFSGDLTALGGNAVMSYGIYSVKGMRCMGEEGNAAPRLTATGGTAASMSVGIWIAANDGMFWMNELTGLVTATGGSAPQSMGMLLSGKGDIYIDGGAMELMGGTASAASGGLFMNGGELNNAGALTATGGSSNASSYGMYLQGGKALTALGGTLKATGGAAPTLSAGICGISGTELGVGGASFQAQGKTYATNVKPALGALQQAKQGAYGESDPMGIYAEGRLTSYKNISIKPGGGKRV